MDHHPHDFSDFVAPRAMTTCHPCKTGFASQRAFVRHLRETKAHRIPGVTTVDKHQCRSCSQGFARNHDRSRHEREQHGNGKTNCPRCGKVLRSKAPHNNHSGFVCSEATPVVASILRKKSDSHADHRGISRHTYLLRRNPARRHKLHGDKPLLCMVCKKPFETSNFKRLLNHLNEHSLDFKKFHRCEECGIDFAYKADLEAHQRPTAKDGCGSKSRLTQPFLGRDSAGYDRLILWDRLRHWEQYQLRAYLDQVNALSARRLGGRYIETEGANACRRCCILNFYQREYPDEYQSCYEQRLQDHQEAPLDKRLLCCDQGLALTLTDRLITKLTARSRRASSVGEPSHDSNSQVRADSMTGVSYFSNNLLNVLHKAAYAGNSCSIKHCISEGVDIHGIDIYGRTAAHWAATSGSTRAAKLLLGYGARIDATDHEGQTPLFMAVQSQVTPMVEMLLKAGADVLARDTMPQSCIHIAAASGEVPMIKLLINYEADVNALNCFRQSPLLLATKSGHLDAVRVFCDSKANIELCDHAGRTPLFSALDKKYFALAHYLLIDRNAVVSSAMIETATRRGADNELVASLEARLRRTSSMIKPS